MKRSGIKPPKFADRFAVCDFEAEPMPVLSLYRPPEERPLFEWRMDVVDAGGRRIRVEWRHLCALPRVRERRHLICQIFHWREEVEWEGVRLADFLDRLALFPDHEAYVAFHSADGAYFETLPQAIARDPRVLLAFGLNGGPLPAAHGGPVRLVVPFLQGYKSVKWLDRIHVQPADPLGTKRLLGQSRSAHLTSQDLQEIGGSVTVVPREGGLLAEI